MMARSTCIVVSLFVLLTIVGGCQKASSPPPPPPELTAEQKLEVLVERLEGLFSNKPGTPGLVVKRDITQRLLPTEEPSDVLRAEITVSTERFITLPVSGEEASSEEETTEQQDDQPVVNHSDSETKTYQLSYRDNHWQMDTELTEELEKLWFEYALDRR